MSQEGQYEKKKEIEVTCGTYTFPYVLTTNANGLSNLKYNNSIGGLVITFQSLEV